MLPVTAAATLCASLVDEWLRHGLTHAVVCPGSRSTPLALAFDDAASDGLVELAVVLDERSAGFLALGIARATGRPVPVLTTSGTAAVNLHAAVVEAHHDAVPLIACTADRPPELHGVGAPQTIEQGDLFGSATRASIDAGVPDDSDPNTWRSLAHEVWRWSVGSVDALVPPGPVQLNLPFREPLVGRSGSLPPPAIHEGEGPGRTSPLPAGLAARLVHGARTLLVLGPPLGDTPDLVERVQRLGWPLLCDPRVGVEGPTVVRRGDLILRSESFRTWAAPEVVLRLGALPASRVVGTWLDQAGGYHLGLDPWGRCFDPGGSLDSTVAAGAGDLVRFLDSLDPPPAPEAWSQGWADAERAAEGALVRELERPAMSAQVPITEAVVARLATKAAADRGAPLVVSSSMPIRDVEAFGDRRARPVHANRGANGIDGVVSTAVGVSLGVGSPTVALVGDLALLHDTNGLLVAHGTQAALTLVVVDNGGGGIFHFLPQYDLLSPGTFERLYGTPPAVDLVEVIRAHGVPVQRVHSGPALVEGILAGSGGPSALVVSTDRTENPAEHRYLAERVAAAVSAVLGG